MRHPELVEDRDALVQAVDNMAARVKAVIGEWREEAAVLDRVLDELERAATSKLESARRRLLAA